jgi:cytoskeletal protein RodZ
VNTGTARIIIIVALLVTGGLVLANGFAAPAAVEAASSEPDVVTSPSPSPSTDAPETDSPAPAVEETPKPAAPKDVRIAVFNGTYESFLAGTVQDELVAEGYRSGQDPTDTDSKPVERTVVYFVGGADAAQNESDATELAGTHFKGAKVKELSADVGDVDQSVEVVVVLGEDYVSPAA